MKPLLSLPLCAVLLTAAQPPVTMLRIHLSAGNRIAELPLEQYVAAVLAGESRDFRSDQALSAMAVVARTWGIRMRGRHSAQGFDLCDTTHCQRVDLASVTTRLQAAARATAGEMLWFNARPAFTPFSADCGGSIEDAGAVWPDMAAPYLKSRPDKWCAADPRWHWNASAAQILSALQTSGLRAPPTLNRVEVLTQTPSRRAAVLLLSGPSASVRLSASSLRFAIGRELGFNSLPADSYTVHASGDHFLFDGSGSGHGVGLCQHGADQMGRAGHTYREILAWYFPSAVPGLNAGEALHWETLQGEILTLKTLHPSEDRPVLARADRLARSLSARTRWSVPTGTTLRIFPDLEAFRNATAEPGWVAAHTSGVVIDLQPARLLQSRGALESTLTHELLHVMMNSVEAPGLPVWFREGLAAYLEHAPATAAPAIPPDADLRQTSDPDRARRAYSQATAMVASLVRTYSESVVLDWVRRGLPPELRNASASHPAPKSR